MSGGNFPIAKLEVSNYVSHMEIELAANLMTLGAAFGVARKLEETTVGRLCAADGRFFLRIRDGKTFTAKKYDEVVAWFSTNWPANTPWPDTIARPTADAAVAKIVADEAVA